MFRNRQNSQKPPDELYQSFKAVFPAVANPASTAGPLESSTSLTDALDVAVSSRHYDDHHEIKDLDPTPRGSNEPWRFTPSLLDPNSFAFSHFANQPPGYYTPTPGGTNTLYHPQAGDLHTPGFSLGLGTPLSMPTSETGLHAGQPSHIASHGFHSHSHSHSHSQSMAPHVFQNPNPFGFPPPHHAQTFPPHQFSHHPSAFEGFGHHHEQPKMEDSMHNDVEMQEHSPTDGMNPHSYDTNMAQVPVQQPAENFRYHVTLNAPTAMIKHSNEIPVTYLNKGQAYTIAIVDTQPPQPNGMPSTYRTFVRISFEDEQQRLRPSACWQLWKEGRGTNEAHHRGGRLQAVEFVDPAQVGGLEGSGRPKIDIESASFDGFSVTWTAPPNSPPECSIAVRFNFLSTDFSHSKGVKGIPVRLCAKTELRTTQSPTSHDLREPELCFCKVKLFRDHGAERKLSNDIAHVKKTIDKLKQQIAQVESGVKDLGKRKRSGSISKSSTSSGSRPGKVPKHKRTWSMSSASSTGGHRGSQEEDLQLKLANLQDMFTSTRPASVLYLKGEEGDDPDLHPVRLSGEPTDLVRVNTGESAGSGWERQSGHTSSSMVSPSPSNRSLHSSDRRESDYQQTGSFSAAQQNWQDMSQNALGEVAPQNRFSPPGVSVKVPKSTPADGGTLAGWIEALGVDPHYQPPPERVIKPVACFYVQPRFVGKAPEDQYYRAVYLMQRTLKDLVNGIAMKCNIEATKVLRTIRINKQGINILFDDEAVLQLPEGQDLVAEFNEMHPRSPMRREWDAAPNEVQVDGDIDIANTMQSEGFELRLLF